MKTKMGMFNMALIVNNWLFFNTLLAQLAKGQVSLWDCAASVRLSIIRILSL